MGKKVPLGRLMGLGCRPVRDFSDSFRRVILGNPDAAGRILPCALGLGLLMGDRALFVMSEFRYLGI